jgi:UDP-N-acetylglucosamine 4-epimerase
MKSRYECLQETILRQPKTWLITGVAGFIGSNLLEKLLELNQNVIGLDNFLTGNPTNLSDVKSQVSEEKWRNFRFVEGDIRNLTICESVCAGVDFILHQAALGSVPRSVENPLATNEHNVVGFLNMILAAKQAEVTRFIYATSSSVYGDHKDLPKEEERVGRPLSPYAVTKRVNELYADVFARNYGLETVGLRYFNVFGPRQDPEGPYAAVIPKWFASLGKGEVVYINGDGETSRDFCFVENVVQANILAAYSDDESVLGRVFNVAYGEATTLNQLFNLISEIVSRNVPSASKAGPNYQDFRPGDIRHSLADISKAKKILNYEPQFSLGAGLEKAALWYLNRERSRVVPFL